MVSNSAADGPHSFRALFQTYCKELDGANEKRERLVKASRDITAQSKKLIFSLHRFVPPSRADTPSTSPADLPELLHASRELAAITQHIATRICPELDEGDCVRFARAISPCLQEYVEAALFLHYLAHGRLLSRVSLEQTLSAACAEVGAPPLPLSASDYVLGAADLGGELMRHAVAAAARGAVADALRVRNFLVRFQTLLLVAPRSTDAGRFASEVDSKARVLAQSIAKVERACFDLSVRRAEFPGVSLPAVRRPATAPLEERANVKRRRTGDS